MRLNSTGIVFSEQGDVVTWLWPWKRPHSEFRVRSLTYGMAFDSLKSYWKYVGGITPLQESVFAKDERLKGYELERVLWTWVNFTHPGKNVVILHNLDPEAKGTSFWLRIPQDKVRELLNDIVVIRCDSQKDVIDLVDSVPEHFAQAYGYCVGYGDAYTNLGHRK
jgi:hypothetical protein